jgi:(p)ppGpp synthase/HD superfamily hydrolase
MTFVERAKDLAHRAHAGQVDKAGRPYIEHVSRVAAACADDPIAEAVAWCHDLIEDGDSCFLDEFAGEMPDSIFWPVWTLSRTTAGTEDRYYDRIRVSSIALRVKLADIADNADEARLALLDEATASRLRKKYASALEALTGSSARAGRGGG